MTYLRTRYHVIGLIEPANRILVISGNSPGLERMSFFVSLLFSSLSLLFVFPSSCCYSFFVVFPSCFSGARKMAMFLVLLIVYLHKKMGGIRQLDDTVPSRTSTAVHALVCCVLPSRRFFARFVTWYSIVIYINIFRGNELS